MTMIQRSFEVCGITTTNPELVRNDCFLKRIMTNAELGSDRTDNDDLKAYLKTKTKNFLFNFCIQCLLIFLPFY